MYISEEYKPVWLIGEKNQRLKKKYNWHGLYTGVLNRAKFMVVILMGATHCKATKTIKDLINPMFLLCRAHQESLFQN